ncbi:trypsin-like peptidase domain-containing protein [Enterobacillus tribolii]|uniref:TerD domain-containing protein n=1 Tax=Enterobacillus tribolii TaxID=1487935 RepID=A0A370R1K9_9GAMM|nr:trypsin-like peptidase domain-containing protein [Enterobacillus tribolii]MBW7983086.1 trypsin [Enterobacillus tribolii]RDK95810.1 TerD domain-containing protein [Enterobacillus tribolii]
MRQLAAGENIELLHPEGTWSVECGVPSMFGAHAAVALLPVDDKKQATGAPALLHDEQSWMEWSGDANKVSCFLRPAQLPGNSQRVLVVIYTYASKRPVRDLRSIHLSLPDDVEYRVNLGENGESAIIIGEFYLRQGKWKFRALAEGSAYGLSALGRRLNLEINDRRPGEESPDSEGGHERPSSATGTAFAIDGTHLMTCAHVIEDMETLYVRSFDGRFRVEAVKVDPHNDIALLRIQGAPVLKPVVFRERGHCDLAENVIALGFPLSGISGDGIQVTQGGVSGMFGPENDVTKLQFTAPIQPGSSGSPLFDGQGRVIGMVTSTIRGAQNMNYAVKSVLLTAFLDACRLSPGFSSSQDTLSAAEVTRQVQSSVWLLEASNG